MLLNIEYSRQFKKDLKKAQKQKKNLEYLKKIANKIVKQTSLPDKVRDHKLIGDWNECRELHLESDWLLIYKLSLKYKTVTFVRLGSHSELFK